MVRTVVTGISGRMGSAIVRAVRDDDDMELAGATERRGSEHIGLDAGLVTRLGPLEVPVTDDIEIPVKSADAVIDFTSAEASVEHAKICAKHKVALVVGSTGMTPAQKAEIAAFAKQTAILMAPNMSVGVNLLLRLCHEAARVLGDAYEVEIVELHHRLKKDAPSGTALRLGEVVAHALGRDPAKDFKYERHGNIGERTRKEIGIQTVRGGDIVGEHTVYFIGNGERLELTHRATSRDQFAVGAARAAKWLVGKPPGLYDMTDVLGLKNA